MFTLPPPQALRWKFTDCLTNCIVKCIYRSVAMKNFGHFNFLFIKISCFRPPSLKATGDEADVYLAHLLIITHHACKNST